MMDTSRRAKFAEEDKSPANQSTRRRFWKLTWGGESRAALREIASASFPACQQQEDKADNHRVIGD